MDQILDSRPAQITGKLFFLTTFFGGLINFITQMEIFKGPIFVVTGILGIVFMVYKIWVIAHDLKERQEKREAEGKKPISFKFWQKWKFRRS